MEVLELLRQWDLSVGSALEENSLKFQAKLLTKKHDLKVVEIDVLRYDNTNNITETVKESKCLIRFKDVVIKYRPHLHMGDYWLSVKIVNEKPIYKFYNIIEIDSKVTVINAAHPHFSNGVPCLGSFGGELMQAFTSGQFINFSSSMRAYLQAYNSRSTYTNGTQYKKQYIYYALHSRLQIDEMFNDGANEVSVTQVAQDSSRWNWPKELPAWGKIEVSGQDTKSIFEYATKTKYPLLKDEHLYNCQTWRHSTSFHNKPVKVFGYIALAITLGELTLWQAIEFVRIFLLSLQAQHEGNMTPETLEELKLLAQEIYNIDRNKYVKLTSRYIITLGEDQKALVSGLWTKVKPFYSQNRTEELPFFETLKFAGFNFANFMVLLRKRSPENAASSVYLASTRMNNKTDINNINDKLESVKLFAYKTAITQLDKDRRKFVNECRKSKINNTNPNDGQGTLFSQSL